MSADDKSREPYEAPRAEDVENLEGTVATASDKGTDTDDAVDTN